MYRKNGTDKLQTDMVNSLGGHGLSERRLLGQAKLREELITLRRVLKVKVSRGKDVDK